MITMLVALVSGGIIGALFARPSEKRNQCGAWMDFKWEKKVWDSDKRVLRRMRCPERCDPRCQAGSCTLHCRDSQRCNGSCLTT